MILSPSSDDIRLASIERRVEKNATCPTMNTVTHTTIQPKNSQSRPSSPVGKKNGRNSRLNAPITSCEKITSRSEERYFCIKLALHTYEIACSNAVATPARIPTASIIALLCFRFMITFSLI